MTQPIFSIQIQSSEIRNKLIQLENLTQTLGSRRLVVGSNRDYMRKHQLGLEGLPKREVLGVSKKDEVIILEIIDDAVNKPVEGSAISALKEIGEYMLLATDERFITETAPDGTKWTPNTPYTIAQKKALGRIQKVLQSTGIARATITYQIL